MAKEKSSKATALLNLIQAQTPPSTVEAEAPAKERKPVTTTKGSATERRAAAPKAGPGRRVTIYLHEGDRRIIQELIAYLAGQGRRGLSESSTIKAALRVAKPGAELLRAHEEAASQDQRFKHSA
jgi:hypothetical protein